MTDLLPPDPSLEESLAKEFVKSVRERSINDMLAFIRGEVHMNADLKNQIDGLHLGLNELDILNRLVYESIDYSIHVFLDYIEFCVATEKISVQVSGKEGKHLFNGAMLPGRYIGWSEEYGSRRPTAIDKA